MYHSRFNSGYERVGGMDKNQILHVNITLDMIEEARKDSEWLNTKVGKSTRYVYEDYNIIGSLAHQIVEKKFDEMELGYESTRKIKYRGGDKYDIKYENDKLDIKGTHGKLDQYYYNKTFLIFEKQLEDEDKLPDYFVFCLISPDMDEGWIFGVINAHDFLSKAETVTLKYTNKAIKARELKGFTNYVYRT